MRGLGSNSDPIPALATDPDYLCEQRAAGAPYIAPSDRLQRLLWVINGRQTMSASAAAFFESSRRGRGRPAGLILDVGAGRHPRRGGGPAELPASATSRSSRR